MPLFLDLGEIRVVHACWEEHAIQVRITSYNVCYTKLLRGGLLLQRIGYKKTALIAIAVGFVGVGIQYLSGHASETSAFTVYLIGAFVAGFSIV